MAELIEHLESFLGPMSGGSRGDETTPEGVQVAWFGPDVPFGGVTTQAARQTARVVMSPQYLPDAFAVCHTDSVP